MGVGVTEGEGVIVGVAELVGVAVEVGVVVKVGVGEGVAEDVRVGTGVCVFTGVEEDVFACDGEICTSGIWVRAVGSETTGTVFRVVQDIDMKMNRVKNKNRPDLVCLCIGTCSLKGSRD